MSDALEVLATGKKRTKVVATINNGDALLSKQEIEVIEKELKALEILRRGNFEFGDKHKFRITLNSGIILTKEEFELLKEVLNNGL